MTALATLAKKIRERTETLYSVLGVPEETRHRPHLCLPLDTVDGDAILALNAVRRTVGWAAERHDKLVAITPEEERAALLESLPASDLVTFTMAHSEAEAIMANLGADGVHSTRSAFAPDLIDVFRTGDDGKPSTLPALRISRDLENGCWVVTSLADVRITKQTWCPNIYHAHAFALGELGIVPANGIEIRL
ncbi:hypothetical protein ACFCZ3_20010 [Cellulosimicrobium cellulans]|uniref:hypothetical protein n=1 Tax=Cellulosimicrobium cellulans TaxID=1710 RepID=UPI0035E1C5F0